MAMKRFRQRMKKTMTAVLAAAVMMTSVPQKSLVQAQTLSETEDILFEQTDGTIEKNIGESADQTEMPPMEENVDQAETSPEEESVDQTETSTKEENADQAETSSEEEDRQETLLGESVTEETKETKEEFPAGIQEPAHENISEQGVNEALRFAVSTVDGSWTNVAESDIMGFSNITGRSADMLIGFDIYLPKEAAFTGSYYLKPVMKLGDDWVWKENPDAGVHVSRNDFKSCEENSTLIKYSFQGKIGTEGAGSEAIRAIVVNIGTDNCSYKGVMFIDNVTLSAADKTVLAKQDFTGYSGSVELGYRGDIEEESDNAVIYENSFDNGTEFGDFTLTALAEGNQALEFNAELSGSDGWTDIFKAVLPLDTPYKEKISDKLTMEYDVYFPAESIKEDFGIMKAQAAIQVGNSWTWITQKSWPSFSASDLTEDENVSGYKKFHFSIDMSNFQAWDNETGSNADWPFTDIIPIRTVIPCLAGDVSAYNGKIYLDNVKVTAFSRNETDAPVIVENDCVLETNISAWSAAEEDWAYTGENGVRNETVDGTVLLAAEVDYSNNAAESWSEAKFEYTHPETVSAMYGYNTFKADVYYNPTTMTQGSFQIKIFCESLCIDKNAVVPEGTAVEGILGLEGYYKSEFELNFLPSSNSFSKLSMGIVGVNTDYAGDIYFDNMRFTQEIAEDIYVDATITPQKGSGIRVSEDGKSITTTAGTTVNVASEAALADAGANEATRRLYSYLSAVGTSDSVIFGHQNDTHHKAGSKTEGFTESDTKDITGSIAGIVGIDTLSLTGNEAVNQGAAWNTPQAERISVVANITKEAAAQGALITLSAHMPNFDIIDKRVKAFEAGGKTAETSDTLGYWEDAEGNKTYNFSGYTPGTLTGDVVSRIMPGQDLNYLYTAYLDLIADYAREVEKEGITILFRPFHENTGSWFWWGAALCDEGAYISLYRYTVDYLKNTKKVHNMLYVYGPGSEAENTAEYSARYPGDAYVDMIGYDLYHSAPTAENEAAYIANVKKQNAILKEFAEKHNKLYAITETGVANSNQALLPKGNEVKDWYSQLLNAISSDGICYFLVWANFDDDTSFYTPFVVSKKEDGILHGHEMLDDFISFYNDDRSVFAEDMNNGFKKVQPVVNTTSENTVSGYIVSPLSGSRILGETLLTAKLGGVAAEDKTVQYVLETEFDTTVIGAAFKEETGLWEAGLSLYELESMGEAMGSITLMVQGKEIAKIKVLFNMEEIKENPLVPEDFENYGGSNDRLALTWAVNKDTGSSILLRLTKEEEKVFGGSYGMEMEVNLATKTAWAGAVKGMNNTDWSGGNGLEFYTVPESFGQKVVIQVTSGGNVFEVYLQEYEEYTACAKSNTPVKVTIPFEAFVGRDQKNAQFDKTAIESIGLWCNAAATENVNFPLKTTLVYDEFRICSTDKAAVTIEP